MRGSSPRTRPPPLLHFTKNMIQVSVPSFISSPDRKRAHARPHPLRTSRRSCTGGWRSPTLGTGPSLWAWTAPGPSRSVWHSRSTSPTSGGRPSSRHLEARANPCHVFPRGTRAAAAKGSWRTGKMGTTKILENWTLWVSSGAAPNQQKRAELKLAPPHCPPPHRGGRGPV